MVRWLTPVACGMVLLSAGCASETTGYLAQLPTHHLDMKGPPPRSARPAGPAAASVDSGPWAVKNPRPWRYIVIHHSASDYGSARLIDEWHRARGFDELGYHFVIDNGSAASDGLIEAGGRWQRQKWGAHTGNTPDNEYNNYGIGICLVGNFGRAPPSPAQLESLRTLTAYLVHKYDIPPENVIGHRDAPNANTECPGDYLYQYLRSTLRPYLARQR